MCGCVHVWQVYIEILRVFVCGCLHVWQVHILLYDDQELGLCMYGRFIFSSMMIKSWVCACMAGSYSPL